MTASKPGASRRGLILGAGVALGGAFAGFGAKAADRPAPAPPYAPLAGPRSRTIFVNDLSGDIDGLFACVRQILSTAPSLRSPADA